MPKTNRRYTEQLNIKLSREQHRGLHKLALLEGRRLQEAITPHDMLRRLIHRAMVLNNLTSDE